MKPILAIARDRWLWSGASWLALPDVARGATAASTTDFFDFAYLLQVLGSLLLVSAALVGLLLVLRKLNGLSVADHRTIRVLGSAKVGSREKILLVTVADRQLLVGVAPGGIRTLLVFENPITELDAVVVTGAAVPLGPQPCAEVGS